MSDAQAETLDQRLDAVEMKMKANTILIQEIHASMELTRDIHAWLEKGRGFFAVCGWVASAIKYIAGFAVAVAAAWAVIMGKNGPGGHP